MQPSQGQVDWPLSDKGVSQAYALRDRLEKTEIDACYTSDLVRATKTAEVILDGQSKLPPLTIDERIRERVSPVHHRHSISRCGRAEMYIFLGSGFQDLGSMEGRMSQTDLVNPNTASGEEAEDDLNRRCLAFWNTLFSSRGPVVCRPTVQRDGNAATPDNLARDVPQRGAAGLDGANNAALQARETAAAGSQAPIEEQSHAAISIGPKKRTTIMIIGHVGIFEHLLKALTEYATFSHWPLRWDREASQVAGEEKFCMLNGSITEITMRGTCRTQLRTTRKRGLPSGSSRSIKQTWSWQGMVEK